MAFSGLRAPHVAFAIAGHHAGMPNRDELADRVKTSRQEALDLLPRASADLAPIVRLFNTPPPPLEKLPAARFDLLTRMLSSCLVDADRLDTAKREFFQSDLEAKKRLQILLMHIDELSSQSVEGPVKAARRLVLEDCLAAAAYKERILSLSVPTGGGKTLSAMAFALKRAELNPDLYRRIIVVIPYLSIIEQNAEVYAKIFGGDSVLEHHSGSFGRLAQRDPYHFATQAEQEDQFQQNGLRPETENWDAPLIVTTSVRFFESLFSNHPSDLRRIHNIARSIVILDEVQVLPRHLLAPLLCMMEELSVDWGCSFVLSTATKPAFERADAADSRDERWKRGTIREIVHSPMQLHKDLRRVSIEWRTQRTVDWPEVSRWIKEHHQALCVVNVRDHAAKLFDELANLHPEAGSLFHLSTRMCPAHRLNVIAQIRRRLNEGLSCSVVSTQLIEAGVDLDFPVVFRSLGPLDSIVQVAGRADREGKLTAALGAPGGRLIVFKPIDHRMPPNEYQHATGITEALAASRPIQPDDLEIMAAFFERYYGEADLGSHLQKMRLEAKFATLADEFELISSRTQDVFVPFGEGRALIDELYAARQLTASLRKRMQRYVVGLLPWEFQRARGLILTELTPDSNVWIATDAAYDTEKGLLGSMVEKILIF
jgi:CRISPR-associated endonuclease/helicase Cas3